jgi:hypothetical protein
VDGAAIVSRVDDRRRFGSEPRQILRHGHVGQQRIRQVPLDGDGVGRLTSAHELRANLIDLAMDGLVEMVRLEKIRDAVKRFVIDEDSAQKGLFRLDILRSVAGRLIARIVHQCQFCHRLVSRRSGQSLAPVLP